MKKFLVILGVSLAVMACGSKNAGEETAQHNHEADEHAAECAHEHQCDHNHGVQVVGVAQEGDAASGVITVVKIDAADTVTYNYSSANQDKIAAWMPGDTVTLFIDHHHHGDHHHDSIMAIKIGNHACAGHNHEHEHEHHEHGAECNHQH